MRGQVQLITALLLVGIIITLVIAAYIWGKPLIQKQHDLVKIDNAERFMDDLNSKIQSVARHGGREIMRVNLPGELRIIEGGKINNRLINDTISLKLTTTAGVIATDKTIVLAGLDTSMTKPIGEEAGILTAFAEELDGKYEINMSLRYRYLLTPERAYKIDLVPIGRVILGPGDRKITITRGTGEEIADGYNNLLLHITEIMIRLE
jgi:hypothetical protein